MSVDLEPNPGSLSLEPGPTSHWLRRISVYREEVLLENGAAPAVPALRATAAA